jgi:hypothetical protein
MKNLLKTLSMLSLILIVISVQSCSKEPGPGGTSSITGKIFIRDFNASLTTLLGEYYANEHRVYLVYGDDDVYSEDTRTHYDGTYRFKNLRKGTYSVFAYSRVSTQISPSGYVPVKKTVEITSNNQHIVLDDIVIVD